MNKNQFNAVLKAAIAHDKAWEKGKGFACYPLITIGENCTADDFSSWYAQGEITVRGMFTETITPDLITTVKRMADELEEAPDYKEHDLAVCGCLIIPRHLISKNNRASFGEHNPDSLIIFGVSIRNGLPDFTQYLLEDGHDNLVRY